MEDNANMTIHDLCLRFKDKKLIEDNDRMTTKWDFKERLATLVFKKVSADMSGKYTCMANSDLGGHASTVTEVTVKGIIRIKVCI